MAATALAPIGAAPAHAAACPDGAVTWIGGNGNWSDAANWDSGVPGAIDTACIPAGVIVTVAVSAAGGTVISDGTLVIPRFQTLTIGNPSETRTLDLHGTVAGTGSLTIVGSGSTWTQGSVATSLVVALGAELTIRGNNFKSVAGSLTNRGAVTQSGGNLRLGTVTNHGTWSLTNTFDATMIDRLSLAAAAFINHGIVERTSSAPGVLADVVRRVGFANFGAVSTKTGQLQIAGLTAFGDGASLDADAGALLIVLAPTGAVVAGSSTIDGDGIVEWRAGTFTLQPGAVVDARDAFLLRGATIRGPGTFSISGPATWTNGTIAGTAEVTPSGTLTIDRFSIQALGARHVIGSLTNRGTVIQPDGGLHTSIGGLGAAVGDITNIGLWRFANAAARSFMIRGSGPFTNHGTLEGSDLLAPNQISAMHSTVDLINTGTVRARSGQLFIRTASSHYPTPTTFNGGTWEASGGSSLHLPATFTENSANLILTGPGSSIDFLRGSDPFTTNSGTLRLAEGADYDTAGAFINNGTLELANGGNAGDRSTLTINGDLTLGSASVVDIQIGGSPASDLFGEIVVNGTATLNGTLRAALPDGFIPDKTDVYQVMTYPGMTGDFGTLDLGVFLTASVTPVSVLINGIDPIPIADAGPDSYDVDEGSTIQLDGTGSFDPDGAIESWAWEDVAWFSAGADGPTPTFANTADDGSFSVRLTVCDIDIQCDTDLATVNVNNVAPTLTSSIAGTLTLNEGTAFPARELASFTDPGADSHAATIDWGDDSAITNIDPATSPITGSHTYAESGQYTMTIEVIDDDLGSDSVTVPVDVANVSPTITPGTPELEEGDGTTAVLLGTITDPGIEEFTATMDWGQGSPEPVLVDAASRRVTGSHLYADDGSFSGELCVSDDGPPICAPVTVTVHNVEPTVDINEDSITAMVGDTITVTGTFADPGGNDTHTADVDWGDGSSDLLVPLSDGTFLFRHSYTIDGVHSIQVCVNDDDGAGSCDTAVADIMPTPVDTNGRPPLADAGGPYRTPESSSIRLDGSGSSDADGGIVTYHWTASGGAIDDPSKASPRFRAFDDGVFSVTLTVTDDDGLSNSMTTTVTVRNVAPRVDAGEGDTIREGQRFRLLARFTERGRDDTHSATIEWGDGDITTVDSATSPLALDHRYRKPGRYTVTVTVIDDDGGSNTDRALVTVNESRPDRDRHGEVQDR